MSLHLLEDIAAQFVVRGDDLEERYLVSGVGWDEYEAVLERLGDSPWYRLTYLEGVLEIVAPSRRHEFNKDSITRLLNVYFEETRTRFYGLGSTTFRSKLKQRGLEPDTSFCIGSEKELPDIAIEVVETSGGIDKLEVYRGLRVPEVWFWQKNQFNLFYLRSDVYEQVTRSQLLPDLDLDLLATYIPHPEPLDAVLEYRARLRTQMS